MFKKLLGGGMGEQGVVGVLFTFWQCPKATETFQGEQERGAARLRFSLLAFSAFISRGPLCRGAVGLVHGFLTQMPGAEKPGGNSSSPQRAVIYQAVSALASLLQEGCCAAGGDGGPGWRTPG